MTSPSPKLLRISVDLLYLLFALLNLGLPNGLFPSKFPIKICVFLYRRTPLRSHCANIIWQGVQITKLLIMKPPSPSCHLLPFSPVSCSHNLVAWWVETCCLLLRGNYWNGGTLLPDYTVSCNRQSTFSLQDERPNFSTHTKQQTKLYIYFQTGGGKTIYFQLAENTFRI